MSQSKAAKKKTIPPEIIPGQPRDIPANLKEKQAMAYNQNTLAVERTELSKIRTELAFTNSKLAIDQTHLSYLRTIVSLIGTGATIYKALPVFGISIVFTTVLTIFLFGFAIYFIYKDVTTYPKMKRQIEEMETQSRELTAKAEGSIYRLHDE